MILYADKTLGADLEFLAITLGLVLHFEVEILRIIAIHEEFLVLLLRFDQTHKE